MKIENNYEERKNKAIKMYLEGMKLAEIEEATGIDKSHISRLIKRSGLPLRAPRKKLPQKKAKCPKCGKLLNIEDNFCANCGTDVRSTEKLLINKIEKIRGYLYVVNNPTQRAEIDIITRDLIAYMQEQMK